VKRCIGQGDGCGDELCRGCDGGLGIRINVICDEECSTRWNALRFIECDIGRGGTTEYISGQNEGFVGIVPKFEPFVGGGERRAGPIYFTNDWLYCGMRDIGCVEKRERGKYE